MALVRLRGQQLLVEEAGSGEPLVLVHGSWDDRRVWAQVEDELGHFHVVSYDRRGHGGSEDGPGPGTRRDDEDDLAGLLDALGLAPAHVVGNSFGASVALALAGRRPELFRTLCAHEPPLLSLVDDDPVVAQVREAFGAVLELIDHGDAAAGARTFVEMTAAPGAWEVMSADERRSMAGHAGTFADEQRDPGWDRIDLHALAGVDFPVLLTQGEESPPFFAGIVTRLAASIDRAEVATIPGAGHEPHLTHPAEYAGTVGRFAAA